MKPYSFIRNSIVVLLAWLILLGWATSHTATASVEFQVIQSLGKRDGKPSGKLVRDAAGNLYGTTSDGGSNYSGTIFKLKPSGEITILHEFDGAGGGANPSGLIQGNDGSFYGATTYTSNGGTGTGTIFKLDPSGNYSVLHSFDESGAGYPSSLVQASDGSFYGTFTFFGSNAFYGGVFKIDAAGNFSILHSFDGSDGEGPNGLIQSSDGSFYGITGYGGSNFAGVVFKIDASGSFSVIHSFDEIYGVYPYSGLIQSKDGSFYGTTSYGGIYSNGTIFKLDLAGNSSVLHSFDGSSNDGGWPYAGLIQGSDGSFYGTSSGGGSSGSGTVFKLDPDGNFSVLHSFDENTGTTPHAGLIESSDGSFYGTAYYGGSYGNGTVFKLDPSSNHVTVLYEFDGINGANPNAGLIQASDGDFYGTTVSGGSNAAGTVFKLDPSGNFTVLHSFDGNDGGWPYAGLIQGSDGNFYSTTLGGASASGQCLSWIWQEM